MGKINILDSFIYSRIAAGEVVERPKSIIKELVENSLDAGATSISISIEGGGIDSIRVTDNGCGMDSADLGKAFLPHATSKISVASDLDAIMTLGFRGEALSSIAAAAKVTISSRMRGSEMGNFVTVDGGENFQSGECGAAFGTTVLVEDLFKKIPARKKFLAKSKAEEAEISSLVSRMILANSDVAIKYSVDNKTIYQSNGRGLRDAALTVYGTETLDNLCEINVIFEDLKIYGLLSRPAYCKYSRSYQTLIVNGRYVVDSDISFAVYSCFKDYLMTRQYPMYVLFVDLPADMVDVNIHPAKMQVRFAQPKRITSVLRDAINEVLYELSTVAASLNVQGSKNIEDKNSEIASQESRITDNKNTYSSVNIDEDFYKISDINNGDNNTCDKDITISQAIYNTRKNPYDTTGSLREKPFSIAVNEFLANRKQNADLSKSDTNADFDTDNESVKNIGFGNTFLTDKFSSKRIGKLFDTYILIEAFGDCYLIDQHAAHERLIYDKLYSAAQSKRVMIQNLLVPYAFSLSYEDSIFVDDSVSDMASLGVIVEKIDALNYHLTGIPFVSLRFDESRFVEILIESLKTKKLSPASFIKEEIMQAACKAAIKGEEDLSESEVETLLLAMTKAGAVFCPHGRPAVIKISRMEIEKWFKRKL